MTVEHRAAPGLNDIELELADDGQGTALRLRLRQHTAHCTRQCAAQRHRATAHRRGTRRRPIPALAAPDPRARRGPDTPPSPPSSRNSFAMDTSSTTPRAATGSSTPQRGNGLRRTTPPAIQIPCGSLFPVPPSPRSSREPITGTAPIARPLSIATLRQAIGRGRNLGYAAMAAHRRVHGDGSPEGP